MFFDPGAGKYRLYLEDVLKVDGEPRHARRYLKLAKSDDLRDFSLYTSPDGGDVLYDGETGLHGCTVLYDGHDADPARRYKLCGMLDMGRYTEMGDGANWMGVEIAFSGDGIHWERHPQLRASPQTSDALNKLMYNPLLGEYALFHRSAYVDRRISMRTSRDLEHWSAPRLILHPGGMLISLALLRDDLSFNLRCGWARFGIMDIQGHYIEGFEPDNCVPFAYDDSVDVRPVWKDHSLNELLGRQVRIAVELNTAILHYVSMTAQPYIRQKQRSFADPEGAVDARMDSGYCPFPGQMNR